MMSYSIYDVPITKQITRRSAEYPKEKVACTSIALHPNKLSQSKYINPCPSYSIRPHTNYITFNVESGDEGKASRNMKSQVFLPKKHSILSAASEMSGYRKIYGGNRTKSIGVNTEDGFERENKSRDKRHYKMYNKIGDNAATAKEGKIKTETYMESKGKM